jgi:hypothetical protein
MITFFRYHGDRRITKDSIQWIKQAKKSNIEHPGTFSLCVVEENKLVGVLIISEYGIDESFMAVHKSYRNQDIALRMVDYSYKELGKIYGRVAMDNIPSLKVCLDNGMVAFHLFNGPTGKPTLWLGGGDWDKKDVLGKNS